MENVEHKNNKCEIDNLKLMYCQVILFIYYLGFVKTIKDILESISEK